MNSQRGMIIEIDADGNAHEVPPESNWSAEGWNEQNLFARIFSMFHFNDNGRRYNSNTGNWEYPADRNGDGNPNSMAPVLEAQDGSRDVDGTPVHGWWFDE